MIIDKKFEKRDNSRGALTLTLDGKSLDEKYSTLLKDYSKDITIPGFRKGKAPDYVIEKKVGDQIRNEATFKAIEDETDELLKTLPLEESPIYTSPLEFENEEEIAKYSGKDDLTFTILYDIKPEVILPEYTGLNIKIEEVEVTDDDISKKIEELRDQNSMIKEKDDGVAENGDIVDVNYVELDSDGKEIENTKRENYICTLGSGYSFYKFDQDIIGMKKGENKIFTKKYEENDKDMPDEYKGKEIKLSLTLNIIKSKEKPALDDEFAEDVSEEYKSVEDLKKGIRKKMEDEIASFLKGQEEDNVLNEIEKKCDFIIPKSLLENQLNISWNNLLRQFGGAKEKDLEAYGITKKSMTDGWRKDAIKSLKKGFILSEIIKRENFEVSDADVDSKYGEKYKDLDDEGKNRERERYREDIKEEKTLALLKEKNKFYSDKKLSYSEFKNKSQAEEVNE